MKAKNFLSVLLLAVGFVFVTSCGDAKTAKAESPEAAEASVTKTEQTASCCKAGGDKDAAACAADCKSKKCENCTGADCKCSAGTACAKSDSTMTCAGNCKAGECKKCASGNPAAQKQVCPEK